MTKFIPGQKVEVLGRGPWPSLAVTWVPATVIGKTDIPVPPSPHFRSYWDVRYDAEPLEGEEATVWDTQLRPAE